MSENRNNNPEYAPSVALEVEELLNNTYTRPEPQKIAQLIEQGLTEEDIIYSGQRLGHKTPEMTLTNIELQSATPYLRLLADHLAEHNESKRIFFLARDAELLFDAYSVLHPNNDAWLLPASIPLWDSDDMANKDLAASFLNSVGLDKEFVTSESAAALLVDSGFKGTAKYFISRELAELHGKEYEDVSQKLPIKLVSAIGSPRLRYGDQIIDFDSDDSLPDKALFPKVTSLIGEYEPGDREKYSHDPLAYRLAMSLQLMPHFHDAYVGLVDSNGTVVALSRQDTSIRTNTDQVSHEDEGDGRNASIVNPVAAMVVQTRLIRSLLTQAA